ncbi:conserved hypothetical protein [Rippkaea orientalis PCC 8801]|uniref:Heparinase II/III family protein n=1 Tax=Rippkaea orientalis (strain PCC 8801 / RF-1) TaxID=41431 RepID=B7JZZ0_RIPO1|nr:hypothetical protein [Rippkaea orientalis]ACK66137.1 conserved hypothetical protein [Rippkaea orientalis PCC 8801]
MKPLYLVILPVILLLGGSTAPIKRNFDLKQLSGNLQLTLKHGVWKLWQEKPVYQNITLDLVCNQGQCESEIWGYAPKFNQEVDHEGTLIKNNLQISSMTKSLDAWRLTIKMNIQFHPWNPESQEATYNIELVPDKNQLIGSYSGNFNQRFLQGRITGSIQPYWPISIKNHRLLSPQEHPRLIFRKHEVTALKAKVKTPIGQAVLAQLNKTLQQQVFYEGYVPNGGYHAVGYCFLALITDDKNAAEKGWKLVETSMKNPGNRLLEQSPIVAGVALAYDLCYQLWDENRLEKVTSWLAGQINRLIKGDSPKNGWNSNHASNWNARARGAAGIAALAIFNEPDKFFSESYDSYRQIKLAERNIKRYLRTAIGDRGFGIEGDHYTTEPFILTIFPFLQAYRNVMGKDLVKGSSAQWILPHYLMRIIEQDEQLQLASYGRHRMYAGSSLFSLGLGTVSDEFLPSIIWFFDRYLGQKGDQTFGINSPYEVPFIFSAYPKKINQKNPVDTFNKVLVDETKGFYNFRNQWQGKDDIVTNIYLKKHSLGGVWTFPDVGSFRIWGLGGRWANPGASELQSSEENVVIMPKSRPWVSSELLGFQSRSNGSGIVTLKTSPIWRKNSQPPVGIEGLRSFAVDYSGTSGSPGLFVLVDQFNGSVQSKEFREKIWIMHTAEKVTIKDQSFIIKAANGATMKGTFVMPNPVKISFEKTQQGGKIMATGGDEFFVIMTVQKGLPPAVKITGSGLTSQVKVGQQEIYYSQGRIFLLNF